MGSTVCLMAARLHATRGPDGLFELVLDRPERGNALSTELVRRVAAAVDDTVSAGGRVLAIRSTSAVFCSGFDLREPVPDDNAALRRFGEIQGLLDRLRNAPLITVACVDGPAFGAGADLVAACDYRLGTARVRFRFPGSRFGLVLGLRRLAAIAGVDVARDLVLRARVIGADEALAVGLLTAVMELGELDSYVARLAADVADLDEVTLSLIVRSLRADEPPDDAELLMASATRAGLAARITTFAASTRRAAR
jgi:enoyl-CoA hydratase/carnithine racemase